MVSHQSYVICTSPRSGSTLLCKLLAATGKSGNPNSYFHNPSVSDWLKAFDLSPDPAASERDVLRNIFDGVRARGRDNSDVFGLRLQRKSFDFFIQKMHVLHPGHPSDTARFQAAFGNTLFIHLTRSEKLEQAISLVKASQTGLWHMSADGTELERVSAPQAPVYDAQEIARQLEELAVLDDEWDDWFLAENIDPLRISYEALSAHPADILVSILDRLGVDRDAAKGITPAVAKLADATSQSWKQRFLTERRDAWGGSS